MTLGRQAKHAGGGRVLSSPPLLVPIYLDMEMAKLASS